MPPTETGQRNASGAPRRRLGACRALAFVPSLILGLGCSADSECGPVTVAEMTWASAAVAAHVEHIILRDGFGCLPELVPGDTVPTITSMAERGKPDIAPEIWMNSVRQVADRGVSEGRLEIAGEIIAGGGVEGWFIPEYLVAQYPELTTIEAVLRRPDLFPDKEEPGKGRFYTCPPGWACQIIEANLYRAFAMEESGFTLFNPGSGEGLTAAIARAYERREPIFATYWGPTSLLSRYSMRRLDGPPHDPASWPCITSIDCARPPKNMYPPSVVRTVVSSAFAERSPEAFEFVSRVSWTYDFVTELLRWKDGQQATARETAEHFLRNHEAIWTAWVSPHVATAVKSGL